MEGTIALVISLFSLAGVLLSTVISNIVTLRQTGAERRESRRKERQDYLLQAMRELIDLRAKLQYFQGSTMYDDDREIAYGKAYAVMLSIPDDGVRGFASQVMRGIAGEDKGVWKNEKIDAMDSALARLGDLVNEIMRE